MINGKNCIMINGKNCTMINGKKLHYDKRGFKVAGGG